MSTKRETKVKLVATLLLLIGLTSLQAQTVKDINGNVYKTVKIGTQVWMMENLKTTKYRNGDLIGSANPSPRDFAMETNPKYQWAYDYDESNVSTYGRLYTWYAVTDSRKVCPTGWHVPTDGEWGILTSGLGGSIAGGKLKEAGTIHWESPNEGATNESGFTALPSGDRAFHGTCTGITYYGTWWSSTEHQPTTTQTAFAFNMRNLSSDIVRDDWSKTTGLSVRCIKD